MKQLNFATLVIIGLSVASSLFMHMFLGKNYVIGPFIDSIISLGFLVFGYLSGYLVLALQDDLSNGKYCKELSLVFLLFSLAVIFGCLVSFVFKPGILYVPLFAASGLALAAKKFLF